jgi:hypothetical protein
MGTVVRAGHEALHALRNGALFGARLAANRPTMACIALQ